MDRLKTASERFRQALASLEASLAPLIEARSQLADARARIAVLETEREQHLARIAELEEEALALSSLNEEVEGRLDGAIGEIRAALGR